MNPLISLVDLLFIDLREDRKKFGNFISHISQFKTFGYVHGAYYVYCCVGCVGFVRIIYIP